MKVRLVERIEDFEFPEEEYAQDARTVASQRSDDSKSTQEMPATSDNGIAGLLIDAINDEWEAIQGYNDLLVMIRDAGQDEMIPIIEDIANEENTHVGQLEKLLSTISGNANSIEEGEKEAEEQLPEYPERPVAVGTVKDFGSKVPRNVQEGYASLYDTCTVPLNEADDDFSF